MYNHLKSLPFIIPLTQGQVAIVDVDDWYELSKYKWHAQWDKVLRSYYARRNIRVKKGKQTSEQMSRRVMRVQLGDDRHVDHINHNTLDNRRENLRVVTHRQNHRNRKNQSKHGVGVYYLEARTHLPTPYQSQISVKGSKKHIGYFATAGEAQKARQAYMEEYDLE